MSCNVVAPEVLRKGRLLFCLLTYAGALMMSELLLMKPFGKHPERVGPPQSAAFPSVDSRS